MPTYDLRPTTYTTTSATSEPLQETPVNQQRRHKHPPLSQRRNHLLLSRKTLSIAKTTVTGAENRHRCRCKKHRRCRKKLRLPLQSHLPAAANTPPPTGTQNTFLRNSCKTQVTSKKHAAPMDGVQGCFQKRFFGIGRRRYMFQMGKGNSCVKLACLFPLSPFLPPLLVCCGFLRSLKFLSFLNE